MKHTLTVLGATALLSVACIAQAPEPDFSDVFYRLDGEKLIPLERQTGTTKHDMGGFIYVKTRTTAEFSGTKSPVRFTSGPLAFMVRAMPYSVESDPNATYVLRKLEQKKSSRLLTFMSGHFSPAGASTSMAQGLPVAFARYGEGSLKITTGALAPGEYALGKTYPGQAVFCFGVDK